MKNLKFRRSLLKAASDDKALQDDLWIACSRSIVFFTNFLVWTYNPRKRPAKRPFILYPVQEKALLMLKKCILDGEDVLIEKSRDMGATWLCIIAFMHEFLFQDELTFNCISRKEDLVDKTDNPDSIFWKIDYLVKYLPFWIRPETTRSNMHIKNQSNGCTIDGESTTEDAGRGGRRSGMLLDEFASVPNGTEVLAATADVTDCRIFNSTPKGTANAFYLLKQKCIDGKMRLISLPWWDHPEKARGAYKDDTGKLRSPWYDHEEKRRSGKAEMAQEIDMDYLGSGSMFFDGEVLQQIEKEYVREPIKRGEIEFTTDDAEPIGFLEGGGRQRFLLWDELRSDGKPESHAAYSVGVDISAGTGASNSCISIANVNTGNKVAEFVCPKTSPEDLANYAVAICKFYHNAYMTWEANGPGRIFGKNVMDLGYNNIYYRRNEMSVSKKQTDTPGWFSTPGNKEELLGSYRRALKAKMFINPSREAIRECYHYVYISGSQIGIPGKVDENDPSGARFQHGDRVIADALCMKGMVEQPRVEVEEIPLDPRSLWGRRQDFLDKKAKAEQGLWP